MLQNCLSQNELVIRNSSYDQCFLVATFIIKENLIRLLVKKSNLVKKKIGSVLVFKASFQIREVLTWLQIRPFFPPTRTCRGFLISQQKNTCGYSLKASQWMLLMSSQNVCFHGEIRKKYIWTLLLWSYELSKRNSFLISLHKLTGTYWNCLNGAFLMSSHYLSFVEK